VFTAGILEKGRLYYGLEAFSQETFMKPFLATLSILLFNSLFIIKSPAQSQTWKWVSGTSGSTIVADFGTRGEFQPTNQPPALQYAAMWTGPDGNIYLFGGDDGSGHYYNTMWEYSPTLGEWMWKRGSNSYGAATNYGTSRYPSETNDPGARSQFAWYATSNGDLWIYGGLDPNSNVYSDLWKYDFALDRWIWYQLSGSSSSQNTDTQFPLATGQTGTLGARYGSSLYVDADSSIVWLFCGVGFSSGSACTFVDVWKIYVDSAITYWVGGVSNPDDAGNYSYVPDGVEYPSAVVYPEARSAQSVWKASNGKFYMFGGKDPGGSLLADVWHWNPANNEWAWEWASNYESYFSNLHPTYWVKGAASPQNEIGSRYGSATWMKSDTELVVYGGYGFDQGGTLHTLNDYWIFNRTTREWTWEAGGGPFAPNPSQPFTYDTLTSDSLKPIYGTDGIAADSVYPGAKFNATAVKDGDGNVWLFAGKGYSSDGTLGIRNDLFGLSTPVMGVFAGGSGTSQDPYQISTITQLQSANDYRDKYFTVTSDIDASATSTWNSTGLVYRGFQPIGSDASPFTGYLEGNGHVVSGLTINRGSTSAVGLFGRIDGAVKNLRLLNVSVVGDAHVGGFAGRIIGEVDSCSVTGSVSGGGDAVGGLAGDVYSGSLTMSYAAATVTGGIYSGEGTGGLIGSVSSGSALTNCYATGNVSGNNRVGGLVGNNDGTITKSYASGTVAGDSLPGGLIGASTGTVTQSYWSPSASGQSSSAAGTSLTLAQLASQSSFLGFDFDSTWIIWEGLSYPAFRSKLQSPPPGLTGTALEVTQNSQVYQFGNNHVDIEFTGIPSDSILFAYAGYDNTQSDNITFSATPPTYYSGYHWVIGKAGASYTSDTVVFTTISGLPGSPNPGSILVYYRSTVGSGNFSLVTSTSAGDSISVTNAAFGEYMFGSNSAALSVTIAQFSGIGRQQDAELQWKTITEVNNAGWQIERQGVANHPSASGFPSSNPPLAIEDSEWADVALVRGAGSSNAPKQYSYTDANLSAGRYSYRLKQLDQSGSFIYSKVIRVDVGLAPRVFELYQNYPNPFNPTTTIDFTLPADGRVVLKVYDILGREVATLLDENRKAGEYQQAVFDGSRFSSGVYFAVLQSGGKQLMKKMVLIK
jgi:hypothetical protein